MRKCMLNILLSILLSASVAWAQSGSSGSGSSGSGDSGVRSSRNLFIADEGTQLGSIRGINCVGSGIICSKDGAIGTLSISGGGGGAPTTSQYWVGAADAGLSAEHNLGGLGTGLVINTSGTPSIYAGASCTNQVVRLLSASGAATCQTITSAYVDTSIWTGTVSSGILKASSQGVLAQAVAGTDYAAAAHSHGDSEVANTITLDNITQITNRAISDTTGTLGITRGGTGNTAISSNQVYVGTAADTVTAKTLPSCSNGTTDKLLYNNSTQTFTCGTDQTGGGGGSTRVTLASDVTNSNSAAYTSATDLNIAVSASTNYQVTCRLLTSTAVGTTGLQLQTTGPTSPTEVTIARRYYNNSTTALTAVVATAFNSGSTDDAAAGSCSTSRCVSEVDIFLRNGANSGTIAFAIQTEVNASNVTLHRGSYCDYRTATF